MSSPFVPLAFTRRSPQESCDRALAFYQEMNSRPTTRQLSTGWQQADPHYTQESCGIAAALDEVVVWR